MLLSVFQYKKLGADKCWYCGDDLFASTKTQDHFYPRSKGGRLMVACCRNCNGMKSDLTPPEFIDEIRILKTKHHPKKEWQSKFDRMIVATETLWDRVSWSVNRNK